MPWYMGEHLPHHVRGYYEEPHVQPEVKSSLGDMMHCTICQADKEVIGTLHTPDNMHFTALECGHVEGT